MVKENNSILYGLFAGLGIVVFYILVLTLFENFNFAIANFRGLWYWIFPLAAGFGTQIGLYSSIKHNATINAEVAASGGISASSMVACCSHFLLNVIPIIGFSGLATFLMTYQKLFFGMGIVSNLIGISILLNHKRKIKNNNLEMKGGKCH
ncbi:hypothetical protein HY449_01355 [Candidatus Pacearchaeota archaeon]|nr:hypothetical protein [Candidatus Pacearchaeota archaeon]